MLHARETDVRNRGNGSRVPVKAGVEIVEELLARHVHLGTLRLFGPTPVDAHRRRNRSLLGDALARNRRARQGGAEQVVAASVTVRDPVRAGLRPGHCGISEAGKRVVFGQKTDVRTALALTPFGHERGRHAAVPVLTIVKPAASSSSLCSWDDLTSWKLVSASRQTSSQMRSIAGATLPLLPERRRAPPRHARP